MLADWWKGESRPAVLKAVGFAVLGGVLAVVQLWPPEDRQVLIVDPPLSVVPKLFASVVIPGYAEPWVHDAALALHVVAFGVMLWALWPRPRAFAYFFGLSAILTGLFVFVYIGGPRHAATPIPLTTPAPVRPSRPTFSETEWFVGCSISRAIHG